MKDQNLAHCIKTVQKWIGTLEGVKITPQWALKRAGLWSWLQVWALLIAGRMNLRQFNCYAPQCFHPQRTMTVSELLRTIWKNPHEEPSLYLAFNNIIKSVCFQGGAFSGWWCKSHYYKITDTRVREWGVRIPSVCLLEATWPQTHSPACLYTIGLVENKALGIQQAPLICGFTVPSSTSLGNLSPGADDPLPHIESAGRQQAA